MSRQGNSVCLFFFSFNIYWSSQTNFKNWCIHPPVLYQSVQMLRQLGLWKKSGFVSALFMSYSYKKKKTHTLSEWCWVKYSFTCRLELQLCLQLFHNCRKLEIRWFLKDMWLSTTQLKMNYSLPHSWRWSGSGRVWGVWAGCRVCCSSGYTRDNEDRLSPQFAAVCCCCTRTEQGQIALNTS